MNSKPSIPKEGTIKNRAQSIYDFLQSKPIFISQNVTKWRVEYKNKCHDKGIAAYQVPIGDFLISKNLLLFNDKPYSVLNEFTYDDIYQAIKRKRTYNDAFNKKGNYNDTNIRRERVLGLKNENSKLIPIANNVKQIIEKNGIENIIKSLREDFGLEISAKHITIKEY